MGGFLVDPNHKKMHPHQPQPHPKPPPGTTTTTTDGRNNDPHSHTIGTPEASSPHTMALSALTQASLSSTLPTTDKDLSTFLAWQSSRRHDSEEQKKFQEDALLYPGLLVFAVMRKKVPVRPLGPFCRNIPQDTRADPEW
jgi:hypothetical protein